MTPNWNQTRVHRSRRPGPRTHRRPPTAGRRRRRRSGTGRPRASAKPCSPSTSSSPAAKRGWIGTIRFPRRWSSRRWRARSARDHRRGPRRPTSPTRRASGRPTPHAATRPWTEPRSQPGERCDGPGGRPPWSGSGSGWSRTADRRCGRCPGTPGRRPPPRTRPTVPRPASPGPSRAPPRYRRHEPTPRESSGPWKCRPQAPSPPRSSWGRAPVSSSRPLVSRAAVPRSPASIASITVRETATASAIRCASSTATDWRPSR